VNPGFEADATATGAVTVTHVKANSPAAVSGIVVDDRVVAINGVRIIEADSWGAIGATYQTGVPMPIVVERNGVRMDLRIVLPPESPRYWLTQTGLTLLSCRLAQFVTLVFGLLIAWRRPRDPRALASAWFLLTCTVFVIALPYRLSTVWRGLPIVARELMWIPYASSLMIGQVLLTFATMFPRLVPYAGRIQAVSWVFAVATAAAPLSNVIRLAYGESELRSIGPRNPFLLTVMSVSVAAAIILTVVQYWQTVDINERRRLRVVVIGLAIAVLPGFSATVYFWLSTHTNQAASIFESPGMVFVAIALLAAPLSITYAVLRHRLFDISFIIRQGIRYAVARGLVLSLVPALGLFTLADVLLHGEQTVNDVLERRSTMYLLVGVAALVIVGWRKRWLKAIDRRFFRERDLAYAVLRDVAEQVRRARTLDDVAPLVVAKIESVVHPEFVALLVQEPFDHVFRAVAAAPSGAAPELAADSVLAALARVLKPPVDTSVDGRHSVLHQLPAPDLEWVRRTRLECLIPIIGQDDKLHGLLALGPKRSEEPYAQDDYGVLVTIAENLSLLVARSAPRDAAPSLEECQGCGACFDAGTRFCGADGSPLISRDLPRTLAERYRLDRRIGQGGMGTVYQAHDLALEKHVAAKVLHEEMPNRALLLERFVDEAKIAARLRGHPNVVTVLDFGIIDAHRPFLIMELLDGLTLRHILESAGRLEPDRAYQILDGICSAVSRAHENGLIHRDLKPENIFITEHQGRPVPKVLDFGTAKPLTSLAAIIERRQTAPGVVLGTLGYMAPEQCRGELPSRAWDLWSLAVIALEMLSGDPPMLAAVPNVRAWEPGAVLADSFPECVAVFNRALSLDAAVRPTDPGALLHEIGAALAAAGALKTTRRGTRYDVLRMRR